MILRVMEALEEQHGVIRRFGLVDVREVTVNDVDLQGFHRGALADELDEVRLDIDCGHPIAHLRERQGRVAPTRPEFEDSSAFRQVHRLDEVTDCEELIADRVTRAVAVGERSQRRFAHVEDGLLVVGRVAPVRQQSIELELLVAIFGAERVGRNVQVVGRGVLAKEPAQVIVVRRALELGQKGIDLCEIHEGTGHVVAGR